jgi:hypothetical protein
MMQQLASGHKKIPRQKTWGSELHAATELWLVIYHMMSG